MTYLRFYFGTLVLLAGCGLISSDVTNFDLTIKPKTFSVDASSWNVNAAAASTYLSTSCTNPAPNVCTSSAAQACTMGCSGTCGATNKCDLALAVNIYRPVDLQMEQMDLTTIKNEPIIKVTIDNVQYEVTANTLNVATPMMTVYVAPMSVIDPNDPNAKAVGTIDPVPAGSTVALRAMTYTTNGKQALIDIMGSYKNPFNVIVGSTLVLQAGDPIPAGKLDAAVHIVAHATL